MVKTASSMLPLGTQAPGFNLLEPLTGEMKNLEMLQGEQATLVMFICNHCPFVKHITSQLAQLGQDYMSRGVSIVAINANDVDNYPEDSPEKMVEEVKQQGYTFPYLYDESQAVAKAYQAACTPDFFIFDDQLACVYRGQLDDSRPGNDIEVTGKDIRTALDRLLLGQDVQSDQSPSIGCNIKWKNN